MNKIDDALAFLSRNNDIHLYLRDLHSDSFNGRFIDYKYDKGLLEVKIEELKSQHVDIDKSGLRNTHPLVRLRISARYFLGFEEKNLGEHLGWAHFNIIYTKRMSFEETTLYRSILLAFGLDASGID